MISNYDFSNKMLPAPRDGGFKMEGFWVWCGSVVKGEDEKYHMFASRWPKRYPMHPGWLLASEVVRAESDNPIGPFEFKEVVLPARGAEYWDGRMTHNPFITKHKDKYILYYTGATHSFEDYKLGEEVTLEDPRVEVARSNKRVGIAIADSVKGPWKRFDKPILPTRPGMFNSYHTSNPTACINEDGSVLLVYKARAYKGNTYGKMTLGVAYADHYEGEYNYLTDVPIFTPGEVHVEDPCVWKSNDVYHLIAKDMDGNICGEKHAGMYAYSEDGINWGIQEGFKAYSRQITWDDGTEQVMGSMERVFLMFEENIPTHMYFATGDGPGGFRNATNTWNTVVPLKID